MTRSQELRHRVKELEEVVEELLRYTVSPSPYSPTQQRAASAVGMKYRRDFEDKLGVWTKEENEV